MSSFYGHATLGSRFCSVLASFAHLPGQPFLDALPEERLQQLADQEGVSFGNHCSSIYTPAVTTWAFLLQVSSATKCCVAAVARLAVLMTTLNRSVPSAHTGGYCKARAKLPLAFLRRATCALAAEVEDQAPEHWRWQGRRVILVDGSSTQLPDTEANQADYPLKAWEREGGDGKDGPRTQRIEQLLKGEKIGNRRSGDGRIKKEMRQVIESRFSQQASLFPGESTTAESVVALARAEYEQLHDLPIGDPDERERFYREHIERSQPLCKLTAAMDEWCAVWFWPTDEESLRHAPTPLTFHKLSVEKDALVERLAQGVRFLHWEMEFPDVFTPERSGFDAMVGNPPWDVIEPKSQELFTEFDPLYRTYDNQAALRKQKEMFSTVPTLADQWDEYNARFKALGNWAKNTAKPFDLALSRGKEEKALTLAWEKHRQGRIGFANEHHPFQLLGSGKQNAYKHFCELCWNLLCIDGRLGVILPTGIYSDIGNKDLREELLLHGRLEFLYAFQNEKRVFAAAHHGFKQTVVLATKGGSTQSFRTRFRMGVGDSPEAHEIPDDLLRHDAATMVFTPDDVRSTCPKTLSLVELKTQRDLDIFRKIYAHSIRMGANATGWSIAYSQEVNMTSDSKSFQPRQTLEATEYKSDVFGRWVGPNREVALPFYEGRMIGQHDISQKGWVSGKGRTAIWHTSPFDGKTIRPQFLLPLDTYIHWPKAVQGPKVAFMDITSSTNTRTMIAVAVANVPFGHSAPVLSIADGDITKTLYVAAALNSFVFDFTARPRVSGVHFTWSIMEECPLPQLGQAHDGLDAFVGHLILSVTRLTFIHRRFAPEWLKLKNLFPVFAEREWKRWWAVTEADRLRLRVEIDALCADLYGLEPDDFDWIVRDDPKDSKGFYRVDRQLPFRERLTSLAAAAFRALKDGKWSAESAATLSNDEFFEIIGIPELTTGPEPLIRKRTGCHVWKPEAFGPDDPRHGWTWDHCWQDAVALLGSEAAVQKYIAGKPDKPEAGSEDDPGNNGPKDLFGNQIPTDLFGSELRTKPRKKK